MASPTHTFVTKSGITIFMSYGLLNRLTLLIGGPEQLESVYLDPDLQMTVLCNLMGVYDAEKQTFTPAQPDVLPLSVEEIPALLGWISEHVLDFFVQSLTTAQELEQRFKPRLEAFKSSQTGSTS